MKMFDVKSDSKILVLGVLFFVVANPFTFDIVDQVIQVKDSNGPTQMGVAIHAIVFMIFIYILKSGFNKLKYN